MSVLLQYVEAYEVKPKAPSFVLFPAIRCDACRIILGSSEARVPASLARACTNQILAELFLHAGVSSHHHLNPLYACTPSASTISSMSAPAASRKRHSSSAITNTSSSHASEHARKRVKTTDHNHSTSPTNFKSNRRNQSPQEAQNGKIIRAQLTKGAKDTSNTNVDESRAVVVAPTSEADETNTKKIIMISSDEESSGGISGESDGEEEIVEDEQGEKEAQATTGTVKNTSQLQTLRSSDAAVTNGVNGKHPTPEGENSHERSDADEGDDQAMEDTEDAAGEPSFGELLRAHEPDEVDVDAAFDSSGSPPHQLARNSDTKPLSIPSATSLTTVLTQALRTNDNELLESCFRINDGDSIRTTIDRLQSNLVSKLLQRIAERLYKRPGRAGNLMIWVQWSIVAHGGYLASQPEIVKQLASLNRVLRERAASLQPLLALKGKLDMLNAQLELRRSKEAAAREAAMSEDEEEPVIYVEGEDEEESEAEERTSKKKPALPLQLSHRKSEIEDIGSEESEEEDGGMVNGFTEDDDDEEGSVGDENILDDEAEETDADTSDNLENAEIDEGEDEDNSSSSGEEEAP